MQAGDMGIDSRNHHHLDHLLDIVPISRALQTAVLPL